MIQATILPLLLAAQVIPGFQGDPEGAALLEPWLDGALRSTAAFGAWPDGAWSVHLHETDAGFEQATGSPTGRFACWVGSTLHVRPWGTLQRRDPGALLRHELTHRRLVAQQLPRWQEEATCLWAEGHTRPPALWPPAPEAHLQQRLDRALEAGTTATQRWAYAWLRAWLGGQSLPKPSGGSDLRSEAWQPDRELGVTWPPERLPWTLVINGREFPWRESAHFVFTGEVRFGPDLPISHLEGLVDIRATPKGWRLTWTTSAATWIAAATEGELGSAAPWEAKRALAAVLRLWLKGHPKGHHPDGSFCPFTHCAVIRGQPTREGLQAAAEAPELDLAPERAFFTGSKGGVSWSPLDAWGGGSSLAGSAPVVPGDPWASWTRVLTAAQVRQLKASIRPGVRSGQRGIRLGPSGPYAIEALRVEAGRRFGWTTWPSNACEAEVRPDGSLRLQGHGWGHNVGLCLATARYRATAGALAEEILQEAFGMRELHSQATSADP